MVSNSARHLVPLNILIDFLLINFAFVNAYFIKFGHLRIANDSRYLILWFFFNLLWFVSSKIFKGYKYSPFDGLEKVFRKVVQVVSLQLLMISFFWVFIKGYYYSREFLIICYSIVFFLILIWKLSIYYFLKFYKTIWFEYKKCIIVGYGEECNELAQFFIQKPEYGYKFLGFFNDNIANTIHKIGDTTIVQNYVIENNVDEIYFSMNEIAKDEINKLIQFADNNLIRVKFIPNFQKLIGKNIAIENFEGLPILSFRKLPLDDSLNRIIKRIFDIIFSFIVIVFVLSWLVPILALIIKLTSKGPVFFRQKRTGKDNEDFYCYKFRSMYINDTADSLQVRRGDCRITSIGRFMRKSNLDEFPQFINVLIGSMSIVGPRPHMLRHTEEYSQIINKYMVRHFVKPGITGLAQVKGFRGDTTNPGMMRSRVKIDIFYIENWNFILDIKIIFLTIFNIFKGDKNAF